MLSDPAEALAPAEAVSQALGTEFSLRRATRQTTQFAGLHATNARWSA